MKEKGQHNDFSSFAPLAGLHRKSCASHLRLLMCDFGGRLAAAALAFFLVPSPIGAAGPIQPRVRIPSIIQVQGETIRLSDLLPPDAPAELQQIGARIVLGNSPLPASQRVFSKDQLELQLRQIPSVLEELDLPERLIISCKQRRLSQDEIGRAIETFLGAEGLRSPRVANPNALNLQAPVYVTKEDPGLKVMRVEPDLVRRQIRYLLWASNEPQALPFYVTLEEAPKSAAKASSEQLLMPLTAPANGENQGRGQDVRETAGETPALPISERVEAGPGANLAGKLEGLWKANGFLESHRGGQAGVLGQKGALDPQVAPPPIILVTRGKPAKFVVETQSLRMTALVTPLESGVKGQIIRVKNVDTQRVFEAEVVGAGLLEAALAGE